MTTSRSLYRKYTLAGPGGMSCPSCCAPQSGNRYAAKARAKMKRQATLRWYAREERYETRAELVSNIEHDRHLALEAMMDASEKAERALERNMADHRRRQRIRVRYEGHVDWIPHSKLPDVWTLVGVEVEEVYGKLLGSVIAIQDSDAHWYAFDKKLARVILDRDTFTWKLWLISNPNECLQFDLMEHSLDTLKAYVLTVISLDK